jgi:hypothetical protein
MANEAGFVEGELVGDTGFNSSPITKGVLFRFQKPKDVQRRFASMP